MIVFDFKNKFPEDYEIAINPAAIAFVGNQWDLAEDFSLYAEAYLHAGDILFQNYYEILRKRNAYKMLPIYEVTMIGPIFRMYIQALELKIKSLICLSNTILNKQDKLDGHDLFNLISPLVNDLGINKLNPYLKFIHIINMYNKGSETGRYPINKKNDYLGVIEDKVVYVKIVGFVHKVHQLFEEFFPHLEMQIKIQK